MLWEGHPGNRDNQKLSWKAFTKDLLGNSHSEWLGDKNRCAEDFPELKDQEEKKDEQLQMW